MFYWNLSSKASSFSNCLNARRLSMFVISLFANLFCHMFNPFNSLAMYFANVSSPLSSFPSFYQRFGQFLEDFCIWGRRLSNFLLLIKSFTFHSFWLTSVLKNQWWLFSYANIWCFRFKWYQGWATVFNKRAPVLNTHIVKDVMVNFSNVLFNWFTCFHIFLVILKVILVVSFINKTVQPIEEKITHLVLLYSRISLSRTFKGPGDLFDIEKVRDIENRTK